jgi:hypothetical protein
MAHAPNLLPSSTRELALSTFRTFLSTSQTLANMIAQVF